MRWVLLTIAAAVALTACSNGYGSSSSSGGGASAVAAAAGGSAATVSTSDVSGLGAVLVDGTGMTLYLFESDTGSSSTCTGGCAGTWPPLLTTGNLAASGSADGSLLGTTTRDDGTTQVTYNGHPIYLYSGDSAPGDANGEDVGGVWYAVTASGDAAEPGSGGSASGSGSGGSSGGYNYGS